jgi:uncharacterized protein (DUF1919 family)
MELKWKKLNERAKAPVKGHLGDAGIDFLHSKTLHFSQEAKSAFEQVLP